LSRARKVRTTLRRWRTMGKQYHFVVRYDHDTGEFDVDYDTQDVRFHDGPIYDVDQDQWLRLDDELDDDDSPYNRAADALYLAMLNLKPREVMVSNG
jgi:hypothetical protein